MQITTDGILLLMQLDVFENPGCIGYCYSIWMECMCICQVHMFFKKGTKQKTWFHCLQSLHLMQNHFISTGIIVKVGN